MQTKSNIYDASELIIDIEQGTTGAELLDEFGFPLPGREDRLEDIAIID